MANIEILAPFILSFEGGFVDNKHDHGGATNMGVTLTTWREVGYDKDNDDDIDVEDLVLITKEDVIYNVLEPHYWNKCWASRINDQNVANMLVDWAYNSGAKTAIKKLQKIVGTQQDGIMGKITLLAVNNATSAEKLFDALKAERINFLNNIVKNNPTQERFLKGWIRRVESIKYGSIKLNNNSIINF